MGLGLIKTACRRRDATTGSTIADYKESACPANGLAALGQECFLAAQATVPAIHTYAWDQVRPRSAVWTQNACVVSRGSVWLQESKLQRSLLQERMHAVTASACSTYVAAGGASGTVYLWTAADGCLVASWPAHFKAGVRSAVGEQEAPCPLLSDALCRRLCPVSRLMQLQLS